MPVIETGILGQRAEQVTRNSEEQDHRRQSDPEKAFQHPRTPLALAEQADPAGAQTEQKVGEGLVTPTKDIELELCLAHQPVPGVGRPDVREITACHCLGVSEVDRQRRVGVAARKQQVAAVEHKQQKPRHAQKYSRGDPETNRGAHVEEQDQSHPDDGIDRQDVAAIEQRVDVTDAEQQGKTPQEPHAEIDALARRVVHLQEETDAEQEREQCKELAANQDLHERARCLVESRRRDVVEQARRRQGAVILLHHVRDRDSRQRKTAKRIDGLDALSCGRGDTHRRVPFQLPT